jgi:hypothetical protein
LFSHKRGRNYIKGLRAAASFAPSRVAARHKNNAGLAIALPRFFPVQWTAPPAKVRLVSIAKIYMSSKLTLDLR